MDDFHAGKAAGHNENAAANKPAVKDHNTAQQTAAATAAVKKASPSAEPSKKPPAVSSAGGVKRGSHRIEFKETFYCCALLPAIQTSTFQHHKQPGLALKVRFRAFWTASCSFPVRDQVHMHTVRPRSTSLSPFISECVAVLARPVCIC